MALIDNLISAWKLNAAGVVADSFGANTLTNNGSVTTTAGKLGEAAVFLKASSQRLSIASAPASLGALNSSFTIDGWFWMDDVSADQHICSLGNGGGAANPAFDLMYRFGTTQLLFRIWDDNTIAANTVVAATGFSGTGAWHYIAAWLDTGTNKIYVSLDNGTPVEATITVDLGVSTGVFNLGAQNTTPKLNGKLDSIFFWRRVLSAQDRTDRYNAGSGFEPILNTITLTSPSAYQLFQRNPSTLLGSITITGTYTGLPTSIEASWNGGSYSTIVASPSGGTFSGSLTGQTGGQGTLTVRFTNDTGIAATAAYVGVGEIFVVAGQSNASGRGDNVQTYSHATLKAINFKNSNTWAELTDPYDSIIGEVDTISSDSGCVGSFVLPLATKLMAALGVPVGFVPCAKGGSSALSWLPAADHLDRTTLYGSMNYRMGLVGACRMVLWWQGETDAIDLVSQALYNSRLDTIANAIQGDRGIKFMPCKLQNCTDVSAAAGQAAINAAIVEAWGDNANVLTGPDLSGLTTDDGYHLRTNGNLDAAATLWHQRIISYVAPPAPFTPRPVRSTRNRTLLRM